MKRILVIDDSLIQKRIIEKLLRNDYDVLMAESGINGLKLAKAEKPDLILLDYDMPVMSGKDAFLKLKQQEETKDIPIIFLTGEGQRDAVEVLLKLHPQGYLLKPVERDRLIQTIQRVLDGPKKVTEDFGESIKPFYVVEEDDNVSICLKVGSYLQDVFDTRADEGFEGNGYDWEALARVFMDDRCPHLRTKIDFDSEVSMFVVFSDDQEALKDFITKFKSVCENKSVITDLFSRV